MRRRVAVQKISVIFRNIPLNPVWRLSDCKHLFACRFVTITGGVCPHTVVASGGTYARLSSPRLRRGKQGRARFSRITYVCRRQLRVTYKNICNRYKLWFVCVCKRAVEWFADNSIRVTGPIAKTSSLIRQKNKTTIRAALKRGAATRRLSRRSAKHEDGSIGMRGLSRHSFSDGGSTRLPKSTRQLRRGERS